MKKPTIFFLALLLLIPIGFSPITNLQLAPSIRLGENLTIAGDYGTANTLCKFVVYDSNGFAIERLSDEYTFSDGSFYSQRQVIEPPYYRGDDFNVFVACGSDSKSASFTVEQPASLAHPIQKSWEYLFEINNQEALMFLGSFVGFLLIGVFLFAFVVKRGSSLAS